MQAKKILRSNDGTAATRYLAAGKSKEESFETKRIPSKTSTIHALDILKMQSEMPTGSAKENQVHTHGTRHNIRSTSIATWPICTRAR